MTLRHTDFPNHAAEKPERSSCSIPKLRNTSETMIKIKSLEILRHLGRVLLVGLLLGPLYSIGQLPTPTYGWNLGNTLEPPDGEGSWGGVATQELINSIADAGFNTLRIPCAWDSHADPASYQIDTEWMARVQQVVDWALARKLYVIINCHWDGGWLENNITESVNPIIDAKQKTYWTQIATTFRDYDERLLFAGANEPNVKTAAQMDTLNHYYQTFVDAVRASGGNNSKRWLVVQGPGTDIDLTDTLMQALPSDSTPGRLAVEVHYYAPYQWCLMTEDASWGQRFYFWGADYHHPTRLDRNAHTGEEAFVDSQFQKMVAKFVSRGVPVILGEFQAYKHTGLADLTGADLDLHVASRTYFHKYVVEAANSRGIKPIYWDTPGHTFDWSTGALLDADNKRALTGGAALPRPKETGMLPDGLDRPKTPHCKEMSEVDSLGTLPSLP